MVGDMLKKALHGHVTNTKFSKFLLKLLENFRTSKNIATQLS